MDSEEDQTNQLENNEDVDIVDGPIGKFVPGLSGGKKFFDGSSSKEKADKPAINKSTKPSLKLKPKNDKLEKKDENIITSGENESPLDSHFDEVLRKEGKLQHPTVDRVKGPKRRPPSTFLGKDFDLSNKQWDIEEDVPRIDPEEPAVVNSKIVENKKPAWLNELSLKQADRRSKLLIPEPPDPLFKPKQIVLEETNFGTSAQGKKQEEAPEEKVVKQSSPVELINPSDEKFMLSQRIEILELKIARLEEKFQESHLDLQKQIQKEQKARRKLEEKILDLSNF